MYINSPGGVVTSGMAIYDTMQYIKCPVSTVCMGQAASMGSLLLCAGQAGQRIALPNARIMVHQPSGGFRGQASDIERHAKDILAMKKRLNEKNLRNLVLLTMFTLRAEKRRKSNCIFFILVMKNL